jgi:hypothetical protein
MNSSFDALHQESSVPLAERFLMLEGQFARSYIDKQIHQRMSAARAEYFERLPPDWHEAMAAYQSLQLPRTSRYVAVSFAYAQLPVGKTFDMLFPARRPEEAIRSQIVLTAVINQYVPLPMPFLEAGHRSICLFDFPAGVPAIIQTLPTVGQMIQQSPTKNVWVSSTETWQCLIESYQDG